MEVAANITWKKKRTFSSVSEASMRNWSLPISPPTSLPNMTPKPIIQKMIMPKIVSIRFFIATLMVFFGRTVPASIIAKPSCIIKTRKALKTIHSMSALL